MEGKLPVGIVLTQIKQMQARIIGRLLKDYRLEESGINGAQMNVLFHLWQEDDITISQLGNRSQLANTTLTAMLDRLEGQGMVVRKQNPGNRREIKICLTEKGRSQRYIYDDILKTMRGINFAGFQEGEIAQLEGYLERFRDNLMRYEKERDGRHGTHAR